MSEVVVGHIVLFATTCLGFWVQWKREDRHHRWQREEQKQLTATMGSIKRTVETGVQP